MDNEIKNFKEHVSLGRTGFKVSRIGIASGYGAPADAIEKAYHEHGVNYFYWSSPRSSKMKTALTHLAKTEREKMVVVLQSYDHSGILTPRSVNKGLKALNIEYADVLLLGWYNYFPKRVVETALKLKEQGKIRAIALSGHNRKLFGKLAADPQSPIDVFMCRYNAVHRGAEKDIFPFLPQENKPGITIYTATCWRKLLDAKKMPNGERPLTAAECYRFVLSNPNVELCMSGPSSLQQMEESVKALDQGPLSPEEMERIKGIGDHIYG
ncbi:MAG: aldo/keto reductase [bacterium]|nr:aldo/keto reductase [bacterium]